MNDTPISLRTDRVRLSAAERRVFPPLTCEASAGSLVAVLGASGTGKTALLLTLAGRMRGWHGSVAVCGVDAARDSRRVRELVGLGLIAGVNDLAEALTCAQHVAEQHVFVPRRRRAPIADVLARVGLDAAANVQVKRLNAEQRIRLGIALALVKDVAVLVVDDLDRDLNSDERADMLALLRDLADSGLTVVFTCVDDATAACADVVVCTETGDVRRAALSEVRSDAVA